MDFTMKSSFIGKSDFSKYLDSTKKYQGGFKKNFCSSHKHYNCIISERNGHFTTKINPLLLQTLHLNKW